MIKHPKYRGKILDPKKCNDKQLSAIIEYYHKALDWCLDADGRVNTYDMYLKVLEEYTNEKEKINAIKKTN